MIPDKDIDQAYSDLKEVFGASCGDYFGLLYLEEEQGVPRQKARNELAFDGNCYGLDGFHLDVERRNPYLFQFKYSSSCLQFEGSFQRLVEAGWSEFSFFRRSKTIPKIQVLLHLRNCMVENRTIIAQACFQFVFTGDLADGCRNRSTIRETRIS